VIWELVFMLVLLKIPVVYVCAVVWWAIRAEPELEQGGGTGETTPHPWRPWHSWRRSPSRRRRGGPHGSPTRGYARGPSPVTAHHPTSREGTTTK
jgi:hypothetical protein